MGREALRGRASCGSWSGEEGFGRFGDAGDDGIELSLLDPRENRDEMRLADLTGADSIFKAAG